jgi:hypothetical protein
MAAANSLAAAAVEKGCIMRATETICLPYKFLNDGKRCEENNAGKWAFVMLRPGKPALVIRA